MDWPEIISALPIPALLYLGSIQVGDLQRAIKAKKALEDQVFRLAMDSPARLKLAAGMDKNARMALLTRLVLESAASLDRRDAMVVHRVLETNSRAGNADYARDVARHVEAKLSAQVA